MAYDERLATRVRVAVQKRAKAVEKKMFGGLCFTVKGNMACGVQDDRVVVRVGPEAYEKALERPGVAPMDFTGRPLKGFVYVDKTGMKDARSLAKWVDLGVAHATSLPTKKKTAKKKLPTKKKTAKKKTGRR